MTRKQIELIQKGWAETCPNCGAISAYAWEDVNYCPSAGIGETEDIPEEGRVYHVGAASSFEWECGKCKKSWTDIDSAINMEAFTHRP